MIRRCIIVHALVCLNWCKQQKVCFYSRFEQNIIEKISLHRMVLIKYIYICQEPAECIPVTVGLLNIFNCFSPDRIKNSIRTKSVRDTSRCFSNCNRIFLVTDGKSSCDNLQFGSFTFILHWRKKLPYNLNTCCWRPDFLKGFTGSVIIVWLCKVVQKRKTLV